MKLSIKYLITGAVIGIISILVFKESIILGGILFTVGVFFMTTALIKQNKE